MASSERRGAPLIRLVLLWLSVAVTAQPQILKVTLLGTTGRVPDGDRAGPSILVEAGPEKLLFDCGRGSTQRIAQLAVPFRNVIALFLTHLHSDHIVGIPDLWLTGWFLQREVPLRVSGPVGTQEMMAYLEKAYAFDIHIRMAEPENLPAQGVAVVAHDIDEGVAYESSGIKITAFRVDHGPVQPALGYRVDYAGHSVVMSGDTRVSENLVRFSQEVDLLIHHVRGPGAQTGPELFSPPEEVGKLLTRVKPKLAVYTHYRNAAGFIMRTRQTYSGPLELGEDLMSFEVGGQVKVHRSGQRPSVRKR